MNRVLTFALTLAVVLLAGSAYAWSGSSSSSDMSGTTSMSNVAPVNVAIVDKSGDTVRLYAPDGNKVLCKGDYIAVYNSDLKVPDASIQPSAAWEATESPGAIFGRTPSTFGSTELGLANIPGFNKEVASADTRNMNLIGQVRVDSFYGGNYAEGTLIKGDAAKGDIASKPTAQCQPQPLATPQG